ncbi:hypothetical protein [Vacuolonema iberomarrocanum]|uniref:hypothetical protein n=1 Tax=Vacuolonema iberomarrocanum TaxID=3454632 RepID=UPI0019EC44AB|nr:calcium-binding protein [filamentous cyanobacterium LEGE 07170]
MDEENMMQVIEVTEAAQLVFAGSGGAVINAVDSDGSNRIDAGSGNDTVLTGAGDRIFGGTGDDRFFIQTGGNNRITGGAGADQFWIANNGTVPITPNRVTDFTPGEDVLGLEGFGTDFSAVAIAQQGADTAVSVDGQALAILEGVEASDLSEANFALVDEGANGEPDLAALPAATPAPAFDTLTGIPFEVTGEGQQFAFGSADDLIDASGDTGANLLRGRFGNDTFILGRRDRIVGGGGDDRFFASVGGNNRIAGNAGADQFWIAVSDTPNRRNIIRDFTDGQDVIGIAGLGITFGDLAIQQLSGNRTRIGLNGGVLAILQNTEASSLTAADFAIV